MLPPWIQTQKMNEIRFCLTTCFFISSWALLFPEEFLETSGVKKNK
jgi:hypothetical protein